MRLALLAVLCCVASTWSACSCDPAPNDGPAEGEGEGEGESERCVRDASALAEQRACSDTDQCPCGSACDLGRCTVECADDADCTIGGCNDFGRCAILDVANRIAAAATPSEGRLVADNTVLTTATVGDTQLLLFRAIDGDVSRARISAGGLYEVALAVDDVAVTDLSFAPELVVDEVARGAAVAVVVRQRLAATGTISGTVRAVDAAGNVTTAVLNAPAPPGVSPPTFGRYEGVLALTGRGLGFGAWPTSGTYTDITADVVAVDDTTFRIVLHDALGLVAPSHELVGTLSRTAGAHSGTAAFASFNIVDVAAVYGLTSQVVARSQSSRWTDDGAGHITIELTLVFDGVVDADDVLKPAATYRISMGRTGDSSAALVPMPADVSLLTSTSVAATTPFAAEAAVLQVLRNGDHSDASNFEPAFDRRNTRAVVPAYCVADGSEAFMRQMTAAALLPADQRTGTSWIHDPEGATQSRLQDAIDDFGPTIAVLFPEGAIFGDDDSARFSFFSVGAAIFNTVSPTIVLDGTTLTNFVPCRFNPGFGEAIDLCERAVENTGCTVVDVRGAPLAGRAHDITARLLSNVDIAAQNTIVESVCVLPEVSYRCAETIACAAFDGDTLVRDTFDRSFAQLDDTSGDVQCAASGNSLAQPFDAAVAADALVAGCLADLDRFADAVAAPNASDSDRAQLAAVGFSDDSGTCLNPQRFLTILGFAARSGQQALKDGVASDPVSDMVAMRLVQRWAQVHTFVASEALEQVPMLPGLSEGADLELNAKLARAVTGLRLLLHPRVATMMVGWSAASLAIDDPRSALGAGAVPTQATWSAHRHVLTALAHLQATELALGALLVEQSFNGAAAELPSSVRELIALHEPFDAVLTSLSERSRAARASSGPTSWQRDFDLAREQSARALFSLLRSADGMVRGSNPLGIEEEDLPLYFDDIGDDGNFSAVSDYLLGDTFSTTAPVPQVITEARDAFDAARTSYLAEVQRLVNVDNSAIEQSLRVSNSSCDLGAVLQDLCGAAAFTATDPCDIVASLPADFSVSSCYVEVDRDECNAALLASQASASERVRREEESYYNLCVADQLRTTTHQGAGLQWESTGQAIFDLNNIFVDAFADVARPVRRDQRLQQLVDRAVRFGGFPTAAGGDVVKTLPLFGRTFFSGFRRLELDDDGVLRAADGREVLRLTDGPGYAVVDGRLEIADVNPCRNDRHPNYPGFLPEVTFDEFTATFTCEPADGFTGTAFSFSLPSASIAELAAHDASTAEVTAATTTCAARFARPSQVSTLAFQPSANCFRGSLGQESFALRSLIVDIAIAQAEIDQLSDEYDIGMQSCALQQAGNAGLVAAMVAHNDTIKGKSKLRFDLTSASIGLGAAADCLDSVSGSSGLGDFGAPVAAMGCVARAAAAGLEIGANAVTEDIEDLERSHEVTMQRIQGATDNDRCFKEAELSLVGTRAAGLRLEQASQQLAQGYLAFSGTMEAATRDVRAALGDIDYAGEYQARVVGRDPWIDDDVRRFTRKMRLARRAAYLAVRAVEYEFQVSLSVRAQVLQAGHPDDLDAVLDALREVKLRNTVNGARPSSLTEVISLRDDVLQLAAPTTAAAGDAALTAVERLRIALTSPRNQRFNSDGSFAGVEIPFQLAPLSVLNLGNETGVAITGDTSCAERAFAFNATFVGDEARMFAGVVPQVNIELRQRNAFFANRCDSDGVFQTASTRPARNLFAEPGIGAGSTPGLGSDAFARARIQARLNVPPATFIDSEQGESTELAARLLFGEYALFIPASSLAAVGDNGQASGNGLRLHEVDDVLLRIEYLSVSR